MNLSLPRANTAVGAYHAFCERLSPRCAQPECRQHRSLWTRLRHSRPGVLFQGSWLCLEGCFERSLIPALRRARTQNGPPAARHRIPLGLLLIARRQLTIEKLRTALEAQRAAGRGRIGEWLQTLGFVNEEQVTTALARQWSCPVLRSDRLAALRKAPIPVALLRWRRMAPLDFVEPTSTLHMAFSEELDYSSLYAIGRMLGCHTEACFVTPTVLQKHLAALSDVRCDNEVIFERVTDLIELARIVRSYCGRVNATEVRLASCGPHLWIRLLRSSQPALDLLLRYFTESCRASTYAATHGELVSV